MPKVTLRERAERAYFTRKDAPLSDIAGYASGYLAGWHARGRADKKKYGAWRKFTGNLTTKDLEKIVHDDFERAKGRK